MENEERINTKTLSKPLAPALKALIKSSSEEDMQLAISAAAKLKSTAISAEVESKLANNPSPPLLHSGLAVLTNHPKDHLETLTRIANDENTSFGTQLRLLDIISSSQPKSEYKLFDTFIEEASPSQKNAIANRLSRRPRGAKKLLSYYTEGKIKLKDIDYTTAQQLAARARKSPHAKKILATKRKDEKKRVAGLDQQIANYLKACEELEGNPQNGQALFATCLACHQVGSQGYNIAPPLDGSANRELHALLTAIVNPDAAVEGDTISTE